MKNIKKHRIVLMMVIIFGYIITARALWSSHTDFLPFRYYIKGFWSLFNIDCMAIGGFLAILLHSQSRYLKSVRNNMAFYASLLLVTYMLSTGIEIAHLYKETYAALFGIIILNFASNPRLPFNLEFDVFKYSGKISYGLYMYHPIAIVLAVNLAMFAGVANNYVIYPLSFGITILIAGLSYKYFESFFLKFKLNYSIIRSGDDTLNEPREVLHLEKAVL